MAQHDYDIANQSGANFRADLNNALDAIVSNNSGSSEPSTKFAYEWWIDTSNNLLKLRNSANNAWITLPLSITADNATSGALTVNGNLSTTGTVDINGQELILDADADTSITADTDDQIDFKIGNVDVATLTNSNLVLKGTTPSLTIGDGGEEDTKIVFDGNAQDFYIGLDDSADDLVIGTGSTVGTNGLVVIENGGNVGINTLTPTFRLDVNGSLSSNGNENVMRIAGSDTNNAGGITINNVFGASASSRVSTLFSIDGQDQASPLAFGSGTSEVMRITNDSKVGIGTTSPDRNLTVFATNPILNIKNSNANLHLEMAGENGYIGNNSSSGFIQIFTNNGNSTSQFNSNGDFLHGGTSSFATGVTSFRSRTISSNDFAEVACGGEYATTDTFLVFDTTNSVTRFKVNYQGTVFATSTSISSLSDGRLKENVRELDKGLNDILKLKPVRFDWKAIEGSNKKDITGFIAQECEEAGFEEFVDTYKFNDEIEDAKSFGYSGLIPALVKAIQELEARVKTLEE
jgi:hypothetical protein